MTSSAEYQSEIDRLKEENVRLVSLLESHRIPWKTENENPSHAKLAYHSSSNLTTDDKVTLFQNLFRGRTDVYPVRWESGKGTSGYSPACANEWCHGFCQKPHVKCSNCNNRDLSPVANQTIYDHLDIQALFAKHNIACQFQDERNHGNLPPVEIYYDGVEYWLADGHHRRAAVEMAGHDKVWAIVRNGTRDDALWGAILGNGKQGFGLTQEDRRHAIRLAIKRFPDKSNRTIAEAFGCNEKTIRIYRDSVAENSATEPERRTGKDGKQYKAKKGDLSISSAKRQLEVTEPIPVDPLPGTVSVEKTDGDTWFEPPCPNRHIKYVPKTTLKEIPQDCRDPHLHDEIEKLNLHRQSLASKRYVMEQAEDAR